MLVLALCLVFVNSNVVRPVKVGATATGVKPLATCLIGRLIVTIIK